MDNIEYVISNSKYVTINKSIIPSIVKLIQKKKHLHWSQYDNFFKNFSEKELIIFSIILESLNFCFWPNYNWTKTYKKKEYKGSDALLFTLISAVECGKLKLNIDDLCSISKDEFIELFKSNDELPILMDERYESFSSSMNVIKKDNKFWEKLYLINKDIELEMFISKNFSSFNDYVEYKNKKIVFNKRCRLLVSDMFYVSKIIKNNIGNIDNIKGCSDYSLPRYFREIGLFCYTNELSNLIDNEIELKYGSEYEVEIRAATIYALELIKIELKKKNIKINSIELDNILWHISRNNRISKPHHTISIYY